MFNGIYREAVPLHKLYLVTLSLVISGHGPCLLRLMRNKSNLSEPLSLKRTAQPAMKRC